MKRKILIVLVLLTILLASLWTYVQSDSFSLRVRPYIVQPLQQILGPEAHIGWIKVNLIPLYLEVRDLSLPAGKFTAAVTLRKIRFYFNPIPLLYKTLSFPSILLVDPRIKMHRSEEGTLDLADLAKAVRENLTARQSGGGSVYTFHIGTITVRNGEVSLDDASSRIAASLRGVQLIAKASVAEKSATVRLTEGDVTVASPGMRTVSGTARMAVVYERGSLHVHSIIFRTDHSELDTKGTVQIGGGGALNLLLKAHIGGRDLGSISMILGQGPNKSGPQIDATAAIHGTMLRPAVKGNILLSGIAYHGMLLRKGNAAFSYDGGTLAVSGSDWELSRGSHRTAVKSLSADAVIAREKLTFRRFRAEADGTELVLGGTISIAEGYRLAFSLSANDATSLSLFLTGTGVNGPIKLSGELTGPLSSPSFEGKLAAGPLSIRKVLFRTVDATVSFRNGTFFLDRALIHQGRSKYLLEGSIDVTGKEPFYRARLSANRSDVKGIIALFYRSLPLDIPASGELDFIGTARSFRGDGRLNLEAGVAYGEPYDRGKIIVELTPTHVSFPDVALEKGGGTIQGSGWIGFDKTYQADISGRDIELSSVQRLGETPLSGRCTVSIHSAGNFSRPSVQADARCEELFSHRVSLGAARLGLSISNGSLAVDAMVGKEMLKISGSMKFLPSHPWALNAEIHDRDIDPAIFIETENIVSRMRLAADGTLQARGNGFDLHSVYGSSSFKTLGFTLGDLRIENEGTAAIGMKAGRLQVHSLVLTGAGTRLVVSGSAVPARDVDATFSGTAHLSLLRLLYPEVEHGDGTAAVELTVRDTWSNPEVSGKLSLHEGLIKIRDIPQKFTALNGTIRFDGGRVSTDGLTGEIGGGTISVTGTAVLKGSTLMDFSSRAAIENVTVRYPAGLTALLGGTLYYDGDAESQTLSGEVSVRKARYEKRVDWKSMLVDFSRGFTQRKKESVGWIGETQLNVRFSGKENIVFESNLAKIPLDIDMLFRGTVNQPQVLGRIEARKGEVYFRRNVFRILYASADFTDPSRINPILDVQAETKVREYRIRLGVSGTADRAVVTFVSDPPLSDSNILSLLALGRTGEELKGTEQELGFGEAASLATGKFQDILESKARSLTGLDRFQVDPYLSKSDVAVPRVTVGKEVMQDRLYMTYSSNVGAAMPEQDFRIEYILNRNISLVGEYDEMGQVGADLKFRFEFR